MNGIETVAVRRLSHCLDFDGKTQLIEVSINGGPYQYCECVVNGETESIGLFGFRAVDDPRKFAILLHGDHFYVGIDGREAPKS